MSRIETNCPNFQNESCLVACSSPLAAAITQAFVQATVQAFSGAFTILAATFAIGLLQLTIIQPTFAQELPMSKKPAANSDDSIESSDREIRQESDQESNQGIELLQQAKQELSGHQQSDILKQIFFSQLDHDQIDSAAATLNQIHIDQTEHMGSDRAIRGYQHSCKGDPRKFQNLLTVLGHPVLQLPIESHLRTSDSVKTSMVHLLAQQDDSLDFAIHVAGSMSMQPSSVSTNDENFNPRGYNLCNAWQQIIARLLKDKDYSQALASAKQFVNKVALRQVLAELNLDGLDLDQIALGADDRKFDSAKQLVELWKSVELATPEASRKKRENEIQTLIAEGELSEAAGLLGGQDLQEYQVYSNAFKLVKRCQKNGNATLANHWISKLLNGKPGYLYNKELTAILLKAEMLDEAIQFLGPMRIDDFEGNALPSTHQPLVGLAKSALGKGKLIEAANIASAIEEPYWRSTAFQEMSDTIWESNRPLGQQWYEQARESALSIEDIRRRYFRLSLTMRDQLARHDYDELKNDLALFDEDSQQAYVMAFWANTALRNKGLLPDHEIDWLIDECGRLGPQHLYWVVNICYEKKDVARLFKVCKLFRTMRDDELVVVEMAMRFLVNEIPLNKLFETVDDDSGNLKTHMMRGLLDGVGPDNPDRKAAVRKMIESRFDDQKFCLALFNQLLEIYSETGALEKITWLLNREIVSPQYIYEDGYYNNWPTTSVALLEKIEAKSMIEFCNTLQDSQLAAIAFSHAAASIRLDEGLQAALDAVNQQTDPIIKGHALTRIGLDLLAAPAEDQTPTP